MIIEESGYVCDPWTITWDGVDLDELQRTESTLALSNGHIGLRATLDEGEPQGLPGTYLNGFYEQYPLDHPERGYSDPEYGQTLVNVTDGKLLRLLVADEPLDVRYGQVQSHDRTLDFRSGTLTRRTDWTSPAGRRVRVNSQRLVSFTQRAVAAIRYEVEPVDADVQLVVQSDLLANEPIASDTSDPRATEVIREPLVADDGADDHYRAVLTHHTARSRLWLAAAMDHLIEVSERVRTRMNREADLARLTVAVDVPKGERLSITKYLAYGWSSRRSAPALRAQVEAALTGAVRSGWDGLLEQQRKYLDDFWRAADVEVDGDPGMQQAIRFALFHLLQAGARGESRPIAAKGLTGPGYDGHAFWEAETFVLPVLTYTSPISAREALRWRHDTLDKAHERARVLRLDGATFPWRTINGAECSAYWPAGTAAFHVNADIADATARYVAATGDEEFAIGCATELLVETARLWPSLGHYDSGGRFRIDGVTGPDEYTALRDNNAFTNLMAQCNLREAAQYCDRYPDVAVRLGVTAEEIALWRTVADAMIVPDPDTSAVHPQSEEFTDLAEWDFSRTPREHYPLLLHYPYFELYRKQVIKQADLVLAMYLRGDAFTAEQKERNFTYYEARTVRDSSLSAPVQAVLAAELGHMRLAYDYLVETAMTDIHDLHGNVRDGLHLGALAGVWMALVAGLGGMRDARGHLSFAPRLPPELTGLRFRLHIQDSTLAVEITQQDVAYRLLSGPPVQVAHHGEPVTIDSQRPCHMAIPPVQHRAEPAQAPGCEPTPRLRGDSADC